MATRDISPLELVLIDEPAVVGPATKTQPICLECLKGKNDSVKARIISLFGKIKLLAVFDML